MKRYGDNLPSSKVEEEKEEQSVQVMYGGCGVRFGTFTQPVKHKVPSKKLDLLSFFGFRRGKHKELSVPK